MLASVATSKSVVKRSDPSLRVDRDTCSSGYPPHSSAARSVWPPGLLHGLRVRAHIGCRGCEPPGGTIFGKLGDWRGRGSTPTPPIITVRIDVTIATIGRSMKNLDMSRGRGRGLRSRAGTGLDGWSTTEPSFTLAKAVHYDPVTPAFRLRTSITAKGSRHGGLLSSFTGLDEMNFDWSLVDRRKTDLVAALKLA